MYDVVATEAKFPRSTFGAAAVAVAGLLVAALAPAGVFSWFRSHVVGKPHPFTEPFELHPGHRMVAGLGALLAGWGLWQLGRRRLRDPQALRGIFFALATLGFIGTVVFNLRWAGVQQGIWGWWLPDLHVFYFPTAIAFSLFSLAAIGVHPWKELTLARIAPALALGIAYGGFSNLWHCCAPLWDDDSIPWPLLILAFASWAIAFAGFVAGAGVRMRQPHGEAIAALLFAFGYPWHTPLWFIQGLLGGIFAVRLARRTSSILTPGIFIVSAYVVHTTLPFLFAG